MHIHIYICMQSNIYIYIRKPARDTRGLVFVFEIYNKYQQRRKYLAHLLQAQGNGHCSVRLIRRQIHPSWTNGKANIRETEQTL